MSHFSLMAIGINEEEIYDVMERYNEHRVVPLYISMTKEEIIEQGKKRYAERCECIEAYKADPEAALKKYGKMAEGYWERKDDPDFYSNISDPVEYYNRYIEYEENIDENGNVLSDYNPESRWDYFTIEKVTTIGELKKSAKERFEKYNSDVDSKVWRYTVDEDKSVFGNLDGINLFALLWGKPNREQMLKMYGTEENYINSRRMSFAPAYCVLTNDGEWHEPGKVVFFGLSSASDESEKLWDEEFYKRFIQDEDDDTEVLIIDCHI